MANIDKLTLAEIRDYCELLENDREQLKRIRADLVVNSLLQGILYQKFSLSYNDKLTVEQNVFHFIQVMAKDQSNEG